jgi:hypothetical protein
MYRRRDATFNLGRLLHPPKLSGVTVSKTSKPQQGSWSDTLTDSAVGSYHHHCLSSYFTVSINFASSSLTCRALDCANSIVSAVPEKVVEKSNECNIEEHAARWTANHITDMHWWAGQLVARCERLHIASMWYGRSCMALLRLFTVSLHCHCFMTPGKLNTHLNLRWRCSGVGCAQMRLIVL